MSKHDILCNEIKSKAAEITDEIIEIRHRLHENPEIMFRENETAGIIRDYLKNLDVEVQAPYDGAGTGTVCVIRGNAVPEGGEIPERGEVPAGGERRITPRRPLQM